MSTSNPTPANIVFVHGAWHGKWAWSHFENFYRDLGYNCLSVELPAHGQTQKKWLSRFYSINYYSRALANVIADIQNPILIGHSMGGLIIQKYLVNHPACAAVILGSVPYNGVPWATIKNLFCLIPLKFFQMFPCFCKIKIDDSKMARDFFTVRQRRMKSSNRLSINWFPRVRLR